METLSEIAEHLNNKNVLTPSLYKLSKENTNNEELIRSKKWNAEIVNRILRNETYTGTLIQNIKTKRYTYNKISRMLLHILTSFTKEEASNLNTDYIRVLGFNSKGKKYLNKIKKDIKVPLITSYKKNISKILDIEFRITKIYSLVTDSSLIKREYQKKPIIKENNE